MKGKMEKVQDTVTGAFDRRGKEAGIESEI
jgi:hypothetical protein